MPRSVYKVHENKHILLAFITNSPEIKVNQSQTTVALKLSPSTFVYTPLKIIIMLLLFKTLRALLRLHNHLQRVNSKNLTVTHY